MGYGYDQSFWERHSETLVFVFLGLVLLVIVLGIGVSCQREAKQLETIESLYGYDKRDVQIFLTKIGASPSDFLDSKGIRNQYLLFTNGVTSDFFMKAEAEKNNQEVRAQANTATAISTMASIHSTKR